MKRSISYIAVAATAATLLSSCDKSWLDPKPLSFFAPENTYVNSEGLEAALVAAERNMRHEFFGDGAPILTEMFTSDIAVNGKTDASSSMCDFITQMTPTGLAASVDSNQMSWYWSEGFKGIKYANTALDRRANATFESEAEENEVIGKCYFHRAYRYYKMIHQFGDVPWIDHEIQTPEDNFSSYDRFSIAEQCYYDMEFAYEWVTDDNDMGAISKGACGLLLMKFCLVTGRYDRALEVGREIVAAHPMIYTKQFDNTSGNLMLDLHSRAAKSSIANTEILHVVVSTLDTKDQGSDRVYTMRNGVPYWANGSIKTPDGQTGCTIDLQTESNGKYGVLDNDYNVGRGIGTMRPSAYYQYEIWTDKEKNDMRGPYYGIDSANPDDLSQKSWREMEDLYYNNLSLKDKGSEYYGKHLVRPGGMIVADSTRCWFRWPHYILYVPDETQTSDWQGGYTPWYVYRSAEAYLIMAEAYYWKGDNANCAAMLNEVRRRAGAEDLTADEAGISAILAERARELFYSEPRHVELVRISYMYARSGKTCEWNGRQYSMENFSGPEGTGTTNPCTDEGYNFYYDWVVAHNDFYYKGNGTNTQYSETGYVQYAKGIFRIAVHNALWPIPESAIVDNKGDLNQNDGYVKVASHPYNIEPLQIEIDKHGYE